MSMLLNLPDEASEETNYEALKAGRVAYHSHEEETDNPYEYTSHAHDYWLLGYLISKNQWDLEY